MKLTLEKVFGLLCALSIGALGSPRIAVAEPDLMVYPTRVIMTDKQRTAQVDIINSSQEQATYRITLVRKRMTDTGEFKDVTTPETDEKFADDLVKYSPRQVTLVPGAGQTIRMMYKAPPDLAEGEYRSHLLFSKAPEAVSKLPDKEAEQPNTISMRITTNIGISIPVIARHGSLQAKAEIDPASIKIYDGGARQQVGFTINRIGTRSIYGDVAVYRGKEKVAEGAGFAVYTPNSKRIVAVPVAERLMLKPGETVRVVFTERDDKKIMAETTAVIP